MKQLNVFVDTQRRIPCCGQHETIRPTLTIFKRRQIATILDLSRIPIPQSETNESIAGRRDRGDVLNTSTA